MPEFFYKYYTINQNLYSSIINNELYFSSPRNFNDPFDSYPRFLLTNNPEKLKSFYDFLSSKLSELKTFVFQNEKNLKKHEEYKKLFSTLFSIEIFEEELYSNEIEDKTNKLIELYTFYLDELNFYNLLNQNIKFLQIKIYYDYIFLTIDNNHFGISCGSTNPKCPLMWGHYGNSHKGICIKYEFENKGIKNICLDTQIVLDILKVKYSDSPIDIFSYSTEELENLKFYQISIPNGNMKMR